MAGGRPTDRQRHKLILSKSSKRSEEIKKAFGLGDEWLCFAIGGQLAGVRAESIVVFDIRETEDPAKTHEWVNDVAKLRLDVGCSDNVRLM